MATNTQHRTYEDWMGADAYDRDGEKIGTIEQVFLDTDTGRPEWVTVKTGLFGMSSSFAPIVGSAPRGDGIQLDVDKDTVKDAPNVGDGQALTADDEARLYEHYAVDHAAGTVGYTADERRSRGYETGRRADEGYEIDEAALTRREEELEVGTHREETGKVRLRKYVTTEHETVTVPVEKERVVVERDPAPGGGRSATGDIGEGEAEMVLHEDRVDVDKHVVDKEQVRARKESEAGSERVEADLRKEQVEVDGDADRR